MYNHVNSYSGRAFKETIANGASCVLINILEILKIQVTPGFVLRRLFLSLQTAPRFFTCVVRLISRKKYKTYPFRKIINTYLRGWQVAFFIYHSLCS